jgi:hypothetical protein
MQLDLSAAEHEFVREWREFTADLTPAAKAAWTRQGWIPADVMNAAPHPAAAGRAAGQAWAMEPGEAISIMESARLHEGAPELLISALLRRFLEAPLQSAPRNGSRDSLRPVRLILPGWNTDSARPFSLTCSRTGPGLRIDGVGNAIATDCSADRAWVVAAFPGCESNGCCVAEVPLPSPAMPSGPDNSPDGCQVLRDHPPHQITGLQVSDAAVVQLLDPEQVTALRDLVRIGAACALVGLIDTFVDAVVAAAQRTAAGSQDRWAGQADKHYAVGIAMRRDTAWLHLFKAIDAFSYPDDRAVFSALALAEAAQGLDDAIAARRRAARLDGQDTVLAAVSLASAHRGFWLDLAGGSGALAQVVSAAQLGPRGEGGG